MKTITEKEFGGDGAKAGLYIEDTNLVMKVAYPMDKLLSPVNAAIDKGIDAVEGAIPGDWDKAILEPIRENLKKDILALLSSPA